MSNLLERGEGPQRHLFPGGPSWPSDWRGLFGGGKKNGDPQPPAGQEIEGPYPVEQIRGIKEGDIVHILHWADHPTTRGHLDPMPEIPEDWNNQEQASRAVAALMRYYTNYPEDHRKITPMVAVNAEDGPVGVLTIRWRGDPYVPEGQRIASLERVIVDPELRGRGIGTTLIVTAIENAFTRGYNGRGASEIRTWVMTDREAGNYQINLNLFVTKIGFKIMQGERRQWSEFARQRGIETSREAFWLNLKREDWEAAKTRSNIVPLDPVGFNGQPLA